jgi:hypothetical protein
MAFDLVPHSILINKLVNTNINPIFSRWISDFLTDRSQAVVLGGARSQVAPVTSGVPQGSVLAPSLFLLFINDIVESVSHSNIRLFADDTIIYKQISSVTDVNELQEDLNAVQAWSSSNMMKFNTTKSSMIVFSKNNNQFPCSYYLGDALLQQVSTIKYLGVYITSTLKWDAHINYILNKASRILGLLKYTIKDANPNIKKLAYLTLCRPILEYASEVWDPTNRELVNRLEVFQNKAVRFIYSIKGRDTSMTNVKKTNNISTLEKRRKDSRMSLLLNILEHENLHPSLSTLLTPMQTNNLSVTTRNHNQALLIAPHCRTNTLLNSFLVRTARDLRAGGWEDGA